MRRRWEVTGRSAARAAGLVLLGAAATVAAGGPGAGAQAVQRRVAEPETGSYRWIVETGGAAQLQFVQRIPDQTRSFYQGRGFPAEAAERYATACVFQVIVHNESAKAVVRIDVSEWRVIAGGKERPLRLESDWQREWERRNVPTSARVAFRWSQFPARQEHQPGDWFQGMIATDVPAGVAFDLRARWQENGTRREAVVRDLQCAEDRPVASEEENRK